MYDERITSKQRELDAQVKERTVKLREYEKVAKDAYTLLQEAVRQEITRIDVGAVKRPNDVALLKEREALRTLAKSVNITV